MSGMRVVIFGCGYVGRELAKAAVSAGNEVWIQSRNADSLNQVEEVPLRQRVVGNLHEDGWHELLSGEWDIVYNLVSSAGGGIDGYQLSYLQGNRSIRQWAATNPVRRFIYTSATSVYPQTDGQWVSEDDVPAIEELSSSGQVLRQSEQEILSSEVYPESLVARLAGIYGPGRHLYLNSLREGLTELTGDGSAWLNLIHLGDIVNVLLQLAEVQYDPAKRVLNVVDDQPTRKQEIVDWLAAQLGCPSIGFNPEGSAARAGRRKTARGLPNRRVSNARLKSLLGWQPIFPSYREGYTEILSGESR